MHTYGTSATIYVLNIPMISKISPASFIFFFPCIERGMWDLSSQTRIESTPLVVEAWSLNHWATRKIPCLLYLLLLFLKRTLNIRPGLLASFYMYNTVLLIPGTRLCM